MEKLPCALLQSADSFEETSDDGETPCHEEERCIKKLQEVCDFVR